MANKKFRNKYRIDSIRLKNYDYSKNGAYFITIVCKNRNHFFGEIIKTQNTISMSLSKIGSIVQFYWNEIPNQFPYIELDEMVVMPNHIHGVLWIDHDFMVDRDAINRVSISTGGATGNHNPMLHDNLSRVVRWYKGRCTFEINKFHRESLFAWQSKYHDRIIRNKKELNRIQNYIRKNPEKWFCDINN